MAATGNSCFRLVAFLKSSSLKLLCQNEPKFGGSTYMEGSVLSFLRVEWKVSDTGSVQCWASSLHIYYF
jgi:hypothetical protein